MTILVRTATRLLFLPTLVVAVALLVKAHDSPGSGFTAGLAAAIALLLQDVSFAGQEEPEGLVARPAAAAGIAGLLAPLAVVFAPLLAGKPLLTHLEGPAVGTLHLGTTLAFDAGVMVLVAVLAVVAIRISDPLLEHPPA